MFSRVFYGTEEILIKMDNTFRGEGAVQNRFPKLFKQPVYAGQHLTQGQDVIPDSHEGFHDAKERADSEKEDEKQGHACGHWSKCDDCSVEVARVAYLAVMGKVKFTPGPPNMGGFF